MASGGKGDDPDDIPHGVLVCVRVRPMLKLRPDGTPGREAACQCIVEMDGEAPRGCGSAVTRIRDPNPKDPNAKPREFVFDRSYWSCDEFKEDPERPGFHIPDGPDSKYVCQDMVWNDIGQVVMRNAVQGYNCTVFAYGQSGAGKSYSVVGYSPNNGLIPNALTHLFGIVDENQDPKLRYHIEIAMLEVYMDEIYDLLEPRKAERKKLKVFVNNNQVLVYDPNDRKNADKIWRAARNQEQAENFRRMGDANRSIRSTGMNPSSSRGHTVFMCRLTKAVEHPDGTWREEFKSKISLVDLAGSERAHDTGLTGIGLKEGIAINQSLNYLGQVLVSLCKSERVNYRDKLTQLLAESLNGQAITVMIAAISPADINYEETLSTLRFAGNAKKMPVKARKQVNPTMQLIADLKEQNRRLQEELASMSSPDKLTAAQKMVEEKKRRLEYLQKALSDCEPEYDRMVMEMRKLKGDPSSGEPAQDMDEEDRQALIAELEGKMESQLQEMECLYAERDKVKYELEEAKTHLGHGLQEKQQAIMTLLEATSQEADSWERKLAQADKDSQQLQESFSKEGVTVGEILGLMNAGSGGGFNAGTAPRYFVNLCEDSHESGLIFFIPNGTVKVKRFFPNDSEQAIKLPGDSVEPHHATVMNDPVSGNIHIQCASENAALWVNGVKVPYGAPPVVLTHGSRVIIGLEFILRYVDPEKKSEKITINENGIPQHIDMKYALEELQRKAGQAQASAVENGRRSLATRQRRRSQLRRNQYRSSLFSRNRDDTTLAEFRRRMQANEEERERRREAGDHGSCKAKVKLGREDCATS